MSYTEMLKEKLLSIRLSPSERKAFLRGALAAKGYMENGEIVLPVNGLNASESIAKRIHEQFGYVPEKIKNVTEYRHFISGNFQTKISISCNKDIQNQ